MALKYFHNIVISFSNRNQTKKSLQRHPICINDSDHDYIIEEIERREKLIMK